MDPSSPKPRPPPPRPPPLALRLPPLFSKHLLDFVLVLVLGILTDGSNCQEGHQQLQVLHGLQGRSHGRR